MVGNLGLIRKVDKMDVIARKPYRSGDSTVITISGIPILNNDKKVFFRRIRIDDKNFIICTTYDIMSQYELENLPENIEMSGNDYNIIEQKKLDNEKAAKKFFEDFHNLEDDEEVIIKVIKEND